LNFFFCFSKLVEAIVLSVNAGDAVSCVDVFPYGEVFATGTATGKVRLWDSADASKPMNTYRAPQDGAVATVRFTPGGEWLVIGHANGTVALWGLTDKTRPMSPAPLRLHKSAITVVAFHPTDALVATADATGAVRLFAVDESDGSLTAVGGTTQCFAGPVKAIAFLGASKLAALTNSCVVSLRYGDAGAVAIDSRHSAPSLSTVFAAVAAGAGADSQTLLVCSQMQNPGGVCLWRVDMQAKPTTTPAPAPVPTPAPAPAVPAPAAVRKVAAPAPATKSKENVATNAKKTAPKAQAQPPQPQQSEERRVLDMLLQGHAPVRDALEARARKFEASTQLLQVSGARLADALKALQTSSDVVQAAAVVEQLSARAQEFASKLQYRAALVIADATLTVCHDILTSWEAKEAHVCTALAVVEQLAKWCDIRQVGELEPLATACQTRMGSLMRVLKNDNAMPFQLTQRARDLREKCVKFERFY
jgi:hypothetical protein